MTESLIPANKFTIGEIAKLYGIPEPTLRYYDQIGLFKPLAVNNVTKYRYYSAEQFEQLNIIQYLKYMGIPLKEIKNHFKNRDEESFLKLLLHCKNVNERKLNDLIIIQNRFNNRIEELKNTLNISDIGVAKIKKLEQRNILCLRDQIQNRSELEISLKRLEKTTRVKSSLFIGRVGVSIACENLLKRDFTKYNAISIFPEEIVDGEQALVSLDDGEYACIYCRDILFESTVVYEKLLDFIDAQGYMIAGDSVERLIIDPFISKDRKKHLSEIQIPVKKR
ncbi:MAG: MerR family transcriptional regulator [Negativicutes bacterium]|nr:MerR family transcriptional regulator [Negativicutes bacterium]